MAPLPVIPSPGCLISADDVVELEARIAHEIGAISDVEALQEMRVKADALARYLLSKDLHGPMLGAQRRIEARIGQLLGEAHHGGDRKSDQVPRVELEILPADRNRFRLLARGFDVLTDQEWRQTRIKLLAYLREKYPVSRYVPVTVTEKGFVRKPLSERAKEITNLAEAGYRAAQIAQELHLSEQSVRKIAREASIKLPDEAIGKMRKLNAVRILSETIHGIDAYVSGLSLLDDVELPALDVFQINELTQALSRSINGLRKLRIRMEKSYARTYAPAA